MPAQMGAIRINREVFVSSLNKRRAGYYFSGIGHRSSESKAAAQNEQSHISRLQQIIACPPNKRRNQLQAHIREQAISVLGLKPGYRIDPNVPLHGLGLDSLMAVELRNALGAALECELPSTLLFDYPTIGGLTGFIAKRLNLGEPEEERTEKVEAGPVNLLDQLEQISDSELDRLFAEKMKGQ
jgi:acyl carrier protein